MLATLALAAGLSLGSFFGLSQPEPPPSGEVVRDLHYGDVLYHYYQGEYFDAITRLTAAREMGRASEHRDDGDLLMAGMMLSWGQHKAAADLFRRVLDTSAEPEERDRARFYLALMSWQRGAYQQADEALRAIGDTLDARTAHERRMLQGLVLIELQRYDEAATVLSSADWEAAGDWQWFARYNLGVALVRAGRPADGRLWLDRVGTLPATNDERLLLRDRANVALGFAYLQDGQAAEAEAALSRVRLDGPSATRALLGYGWARLEQDDPQGALVAWQELAGRDVRDAAVQEALLAVPYALTQLKAWSAAVDRYEQAITAFAAESTRMEQLIANIESGQLIDTLMAGEQADSMSWQWTLPELPDLDETRYLLPMLSSHRFQEGVKNLRDLRFLSQRLDQRSDDMAAYRDLVDNQRLGFVERNSHIAERLDAVDLDAMTARREALALRYDTAVQQRDMATVSESTEAGQWARIQTLKAQLATAGDTPENRAAAERLRLLEGRLLWSLERDYDYQVYSQQRRLREVDSAMQESKRRYEVVQSVRAVGLRDYDVFNERVTALEKRAAELRERTTALTAASRADLQAMAVGELRHYQERMHSYSVEARFAMARLYDELSTPAQPGARP